MPVLWAKIPPRTSIRMAPDDDPETSTPLVKPRISPSAEMVTAPEPKCLASIPWSNLARGAAGWPSEKRDGESADAPALRTIEMDRSVAADPVLA